MYCCDESGEVYSWSADDLCRLLQHSALSASNSVDFDQYPALWPLRCISYTDVVKISACTNFAAAVTKTGQLFTW